MASALPPGIYVPMPTFFLDEPATEQPVDVDTVAKHVQFLIDAGVHGVVCMGSTGEAVHLTEEERQLVIQLKKRSMIRERKLSSLLVVHKNLFVVQLI